MPTEAELRRALVEATRAAAAAGLVCSSEGNFSVRLEGGRFLITPSGVDYLSMGPGDLVLVGGSGEPLEAGKVPSVETPTHLAVYGAREDVRAVIHTHPPYSTALAVLRIPLPEVVEEVIPVVGGRVEVAEYAPFGTERLARNVVRALGERNAVLMANHGLLTCGRDLREALRNALIVEKAARIYLTALSVGRPEPLPADAVERLRAIYRRGG